MKHILILHGWGSDSQSFKPIKELLTQKGFLVYAIDLPGFGSASVPPKPWAVSDYADFVFQFVRSQKIDKLYLLGHSFGGRIAIKFVLQYPEKLEGLILYASAGIKKRYLFKNKIFFILAKIGGFIFSLPILKYFRNFMTKVLYFSARVRDYSKVTGIMRETMKKVIEEDLKPYLSLIKVPTLIIWGGRDKTTPLSDAFIMKENIKASELKIIKEGGHSWHKEQPEKFVELILPFLK